MFRIEKVRKDNRAGLISSFSAHIAATALVITMVLGPSNALARRPPTPQNFRVTGGNAQCDSNSYTNCDAASYSEASPDSTASPNAAAMKRTYDHL